jgi:fibronectin type 3 domain-containing protein
LRVNSAPASIELAWERNTEADLAGYRIYRATGNGPMEQLAEVSLLPTYSDRAVEHGKIYRYAITSVDRAGNESERTGLVEVAW